MVIDTNGRVGIGTTNPAQRLHVRGGDIQTTDTTGLNGVLRIRSTITGGITYGYPNVGAGDAVIEGGGTSSRWPGVITLMNGDTTITAGQDLGVIQFAGKDDQTTGYANGMIICSAQNGSGTGTSGGGILKFLTSSTSTGSGPTERMRIDAGGEVGIGTTNPTAKLHVEGTARITSNLYFDTSATATYKMLKSGSNLVIYSGSIMSAAITLNSSGLLNLGGYGVFGSGSGIPTGILGLDGSGNMVTNDTLTVDASSNAVFSGTVTATNFILSSDKTLKDNIKEIDTSHVDVNWKNFELKSEPGVKRSGVIAQELEENHPEFVRTDKDGLKSVAYIDLLIAKIAELEARLKKAGI
jgi:hypothetical protein